MAVRETVAVRVAKALADPTRFALLRAVAARPEISCQQLTALFPIAQATVSHHLKVLADAGLIRARKAGQFHLYRAVPEALAAHRRTLAAAFSRRGPHAELRASPLRPSRRPNRSRKEQHP